MDLEGFDHIVLTVRSVQASVEFYTNTLGMSAGVAPNGRTSLHFGRSRINLHAAPPEVEPRARNASEGSADICLTTRLEADEIAARLRRSGISVLLGPVSRSGARGPMTSFYIRDPDGNLIEIATYGSGLSVVCSTN